MKLELVKPLAAYDLETTHKEIQLAKIVQICIIKMLPNGTREIYETLVNPGIPIPQEAIDIHHITDDMVKDSPTIEQIADEIIAFLDGCDILGYNSNNYDVPLLSLTLSLLGYVWPSPDVHLVDACVIYKRKEGRTLKDANVFYTGEILEDAHDAKVDVMATINVFESQLERYELPTSIAGLSIYSNYDKLPAIDRDGKFDYDAEGYPIFTFGQHINKRCKEEHKYLDWIINTSSFNVLIKQAAQRVKNGDFDPKP